MFGLFKNKKEQEKQFDYYIINIDDVKTVVQLREMTKLIMYCLGGNTGNAKIREDHLEEFPVLAKLARKESDDD